MLCLISKASSVVQSEVSDSKPAGIKNPPKIPLLADDVTKYFYIVSWFYVYSFFDFTFHKVDADKLTIT